MSANPSNSLSYDDLVREYYENLHTTLRGFRAGPEYLESWVHDENHHRSIVGLFEAAEEKGLEELHLRIGPELADGLDHKWLGDNLEEFGTVTFSSDGQGLELRLRYARQKDLVEVHPAYRKRLEAVSRALLWEGTVRAEGPRERVITASAQGVLLSVRADGDGVIREARHLGAKGATFLFLDRLCDLTRGMPLQEAAEHGAIHLEKDLRDPAERPPVPGLVTPENADPGFHLPTVLLRQAYESYRKASRKGRGCNDFVRPVREAWGALAPTEQAGKVARAWKEICAERGVPYGEMQVLAVRGGTRVVFTAPVPPSGASFGHDLLVLEGELKRRVEPRLEVTLESVEDRNQREARTERAPGKAP